MILVTRSYQHLRRVFVEYEQLSGRDIEAAIKSEFSGDICKALIALGKVIRVSQFQLTLYSTKNIFILTTFNFPQ